MTAKIRVDVPRALMAGMAAGTAYLATMWADNMLSRHKFNDIKLVGQIFTTRSPFWQIQGLVGHYGFSGVMALVYASQAYKRLPGPGWFRGFLFLQIENSVLYLLAPLMDPRHAGVKSGQIPRVWKWKTFWGQVVRHIAFGLTLGALYRD
jgi:hypothetical protein